MLYRPNRNLLGCACTIVLALIAILGTAACRKKGKIGGGGGEITLLGSIAVSPEAPTLELGEEVALTALAVSHNAESVTIEQSAIDFTWQGCDENLASVIAKGPVAYIRAKSPGTCVVTVSNESFGSLAVNVVINVPRMIGIKIAPADTVGQVGGTVDFTAFAEFSDKSSKDITTLAAWASTPATAVKFAAANAGRATIKLPGKAKITATYSGLSGQALLDTSGAQLVRMMVISEAKPNLQGVAQQFRNIGIYDDGSIVDLTSLSTWSVSQPSIATVDNTKNKGLTTLLQTGACTITAAYKTLTASANVTVGSPVLTALTMAPASFPLAAGYQQNLSVTGTYSDGTILDLTSAANWSSANSTVAEVSNSIPTKGLASGTSAGVTKISASVLGLSAQSTIHVTAATVDSLTISPSNVTLPVGATKALKLGATFSDDSFLDVTNRANWSATGTAVTVSNTQPHKGLVSADSAGTAMVDGTLSSLTASATVDVSAAALSALNITPGTAALAPLGQQQLKAVATFDDASTIDYTDEVDWRSSDQTKVIVLNSEGVKGKVVAVANGSATITASHGDINADMTVTVASSSAPVMSSLVITPSSASISASNTQQFTATAIYSDTSTQNVTNTAAWASSAPAVATINSATGLLTGVSGGRSTITATKDGRTAATEVIVTVDQVAPPVPTGLTASNASDQSLTFSWTSGGGTTASYHYAYQAGSAPADCSSGTTGATDSTSVTLTGLTPSTQYWMIVCALNSDTVADESVATSPVSGSTLAPLPGAFTIASASSGDTESIVTWSASSGATSYTLKYGTASGSYPTTVPGAVTSPTTVTGLTNGTTYYFMVVATNASGNRNATTEASATPSATAPVTPTNVSAVTSSTTQINLTWDDMAGDAGGYKIAYQQGAVAPATCNAGTTTTSAANTPNAAITGLNPGTPYSFIVCTINAVGTLSAPSSSAAATTKPPAPTGLTATVSELTPASRIDLSWNDTTGDNGGYKIAYRSGAVAPANCDANTTATTVENVTSLAVTGLDPAAQYTFIVCAINTESGQSAASSSASSYTKPSPPTSLSASATSATELSITWDDMPGDTGGYKISYRDWSAAAADCDAGTVLTSGTNARSITGLSASSHYLVSVCTVHSQAGQSAAVAISARTRPASTAGLTATPVSTSEITLSWTDASDDGNGYKISYQSGSSAPATCASGSTTTAAANAVSKAITGLTAGSQYAFTICTSSSLNGDSAPAAGVTTYTKPAAPTASATVDSSTQITLSWSSVTGDTGGYKIAYRSGATAPANCSADLTTTAAAGATSKAITGLDAATQYSFIVCSVNSVSGDSDVSNHVVATTDAGSSNQSFTSGSGTINVPAGVTTLVIEAWGAGGGAGSGKDGGTQGGGAGGGGGAYCKKTLSVSPGDSISYSVGAGGAGRTNPGESEPGSPGGATTVTYAAVTYTANGGTGGASFSDPPAGSGGTATNCDENRTGGNGALNTSSAGGGGGSSAGPGANGGDATGITGGSAPSGGGKGGDGGGSDLPGTAGTAPGGGGGGGGKRAIGGNGANGQIVFSWQ